MRSVLVVVKSIINFCSKFALCCLFILNSYSLFAQTKGGGEPFIRNYSSKEYGAHDQNWAIVQDKRGIMFFGNTNGLLTYDGTSWQVMKMPNLSTVRALCIDDFGKIYVGAQDEFGYISSDSIGNIKYNSLLNLIPPSERNLKNVWRVFSINKKIIFQSYSKILILENGLIEIIKPQTSFHLSYKVKNKFYVREEGVGIKILDNNTLKFIDGSEIFANQKIYVMCPFDSTKILIGTNVQSFYTYDGKRFIALKSVNEDLIRSSRIYCGLQLNDSIFAVGSIVNGLLLINKSGKLIKKIDKEAGLISNDISALYLDKHENLWLANDIGISLIETNSPFTYFNEKSNLDTKGMMLFYANNKLFTGGSPFLFYNDYPKFAQSNFKKIEKSSTYVWSMYQFDNKLFIAQNSEQGYLDKNNKFTPISKVNNAYVYSSFPSKKDYLIMGGYEGLYYYSKIEGVWKFGGRIKGFDFYASKIVTDSISNLWVEVLKKGLFKLKLNDAGDSVVEQKLMLKYCIPVSVLSKINNTIVAVVDNKFYEYNYKKEDFEPCCFNHFFSSSSKLSILGSNNHGDIYFQDNISIGKLIKKNNQNYTVYRTPFFLLEKEINNFPILEIDSSNILIGRDKGFVLYQPNFKKNYTLQFNTYVRNVSILSNDSSIFGGNFPFNSDTFSSYQPKYQISNLKYEHNSLRFHYSALYFENSEKTEYQYKLEGFEKNWSSWIKETKKDYTNLPEGYYTFKVKSRNIFLTEGKEAQYSFRILPPWYRTNWAYAIYLILTIAIIYLIVYINAKRLKAANARLERIVYERTNDLSDANTRLEENQAELEIKQEELLAHAEMLAVTNEELEKLNNTKDKFFSIIAHDLRNPFNLIQGFGELLIEKIESSDHEKSLFIAKNLYQTSVRTYDFLENLLNWSRAQSNSIPFNPTDLNIKELIDNTINLVNESAKVKGINLSTLLSEKLMVFADKNMIFTVLRNLVTNAIKFSRDGDNITVDAVEFNEHIVVSIRDTGVGIKPAIIDKLFKIEENVKTEGTAQEQGTGLGLILCKEFVEKNDGEIWVESTIGKGSCFSFTLQKGKGVTINKT